MLWGASIDQSSAFLLVESFLIFTRSSERVTNVLFQEYMLSGMSADYNIKCCLMSLVQENSQSSMVNYPTIKNGSIPSNL